MVGITRSKVIFNITPASTPNSSGSRSFLFWPIHSWRQISAQHPDTPWETRGDEGKQSKVISAQHPDTPWGTRGDKRRQSKITDMPWETKGETKQSDLSPASKHAIGDKEDEGRQSKIISAHHPDMPWETRGDKGRKSNIISAQHPDMPWETRGDKGRQSNIISAQHPDMPWETKGDKGRQWAGIILAQHRFYARIENPSQQGCLGNKP